MAYYPIHRKWNFYGSTFVSGKGSDVGARPAGCSYKDIVANFRDGNGQPATVAAAFTEKVTVGPKLGNREFNGLRNFAELKSVPLKD